MAIKLNPNLNVILSQIDFHIICQLVTQQVTSHIVKHYPSRRIPDLELKRYLGSSMY